MRPINAATRRILTVACFGLAIISLIAAAGITIAAVYQHRVLPKTFVAGTAIGSAKTADATTAIAEAAQSYTKQPVTLKLNDQTAQVSLTDLGVTIDTSQITSQVTGPASSWQWVKYTYWHNFFQKKNIGLTYAINDDTLLKILGTKFSLAASAQNAVITTTNGVLAVQSGVVGATFNAAELKTTIAMYLAGASSSTMNVSAEVSNPPITTESAAATKTAIEQAISTVYLSGNGQTFTVTPANIFPLINFTANADHYDWQIDQSKLSSYLDSTVGKKLNVKMVQRIVQADANNTVTTEGSDGKQIDSKTLATNIISAITRKTDTKTSPLGVPIATIPLTTKTVNPVYSLGTYPGLYIDVSLSKQKLTIINGTTVIAQYTTSTGSWKTPTPTGTMYIFNKIKEAYSPDFSLWMPDWNGLAAAPDGSGYVGYGIHGIVCWDKACTNREGANHIGTPVSHGCIRVDDAGIGYIYDNAPIGTPVVIHD